MSTAPSTFLLIEDSKADARLLKENFNTASPGGEIRHTRTLADGLACLGHDHHDVVLLDLGLPDCLGLDACRAVTRGKAAPVMIVTGFDDERTAREAVRIGAQDYLLKDDINPSTLRRTLAMAGLMP